MVVLLWGHLPLRSSSIEVVFYWGCLPLRLSSIEVVFHWGHLPLRSSSFEVVFHWGRLPLRSSSIEVWYANLSYLSSFGTCPGGWGKTRNKANSGQLSWSWDWAWQLYKQGIQQIRLNHFVPAKTGWAILSFSTLYLFLPPSLPWIKSVYFISFISTLTHYQLRGGPDGHVAVK